MILVTGGTGFLGAYIIKHLVSKGIPVRAIRRKTPPPFFIEDSIWQQVEFIEGDVLDVVSLEEAMEGVEGVIHSAAVVSFNPGDRQHMYAVNVEGTANVVNAALHTGVRRIVHVSSVAALGRTTNEAMVDETKKWEAGNNNTHYAISKHKAEMEVWRGFAEGLEGVIINPSTILGYGNWHSSSCAIFKNAYREFPWYTNGVNGFVGVEDVAEAAVALLQSQWNEKRFIVNGDNWSFKQLFDTMAEGFGKRKPTREATPLLSGLAWRMEWLKSKFTGNKPLLTRETAKVAKSKTSFSNAALREALPGFSFTPLQEVIQISCDRYLHALEKGKLTL